MLRTDTNIDGKHSLASGAKNRFEVVNTRQQSAYDWCGFPVAVQSSCSARGKMKLVDPNFARFKQATVVAPL